MIDLNQTVNGVTLTKHCTISPDKDSDESIGVNLEFHFDGVALRGVFEKAISTGVVQWQNGPGRKNYTSWKDGQTVKIDFKAPGRMSIDPEVAMTAQLKAMTPEARKAWFLAKQAEIEGR